MIEMHHEHAGEIAIIHAVPAGHYEKPLPTLFFYHGYTSSKEVYACFAYALAKVGFRVVLPDCKMHGERFNGDEKLRLSHFWEILQSNIDELPSIKEHFEQRGLIAGERIGVAGASMGGMTTLGAFTRYPWIKSAASLMGSGDFTSLAQTLYPPLDIQGQPLDKTTFAARIAPLSVYEVAHRWESFAGRPLLLWHGEADDVVPAVESERLVTALHQRGLDQHLIYVTEPDVRHRITPGALNATATFFQRSL
ncbi:esterase [Serratia sp. UGAL515B_01]|uniref:esterase n=1 Tax=Serratia sp. UGAL515B_01 TaxID=2986763 RepID=UPI002952C632|nr:esterase [Serratia sp. UGAL515B_01]WON77285.1 esterase [Serratia sp. UGAL515B_01]